MTPMTRVYHVAKVQARIGWKALTADEYQDNGVAFLSTPNIKGREIDFTNVNFISDFRYHESPELRLRLGDVLLAKDGSTLGIVNCVRTLPRPATVNGSIAVIRPFAVDPVFLTYWLMGSPVQSRIQQLKDGMGVPHLFQADIRKLAVPMIDAREQRRIADFLDDRVARIDDIISARRTQLATLEVFARSRAEMITLGLAVQDDPATTPRWAPFGHIPMGWREGRLRNLLCDVQTGPFGSQLHSDEYVDSGWPVVNPASLTDEGLHPVRGMAVDDETRSRLKKHLLRVGDIVFGRRGEMGRAGLVTQTEAGWVCGTGSLLVRLRDPLVSPAYLVALLRTVAVRYYFTQTSVGSTMENLNTNILLGAPILIPPASQQVQILSDLGLMRESFRAHRNGLESSIDLMTEYKQSLITAAVTGDLDVTTAGSGIPG